MNQANLDVPEISVVIPLHNEEERIEQNLHSLLSQRNSPTFEIIYIDDGSTDRSWGKLLELSGKYNRNCIRLCKLKKKYSVGAARSVGVMLARGRIIANLDADCTVPPEWLSSSAWLVGDVGVVGFPVIPPASIEYLHWRFSYNGTGQNPAGSMPHGCGALIRKDLLLRAGNFPDTGLGEDTKVFEAIERMGARILLADYPTIHLLRKRTTFRGHLGRYYRMGRDAGPKSRRLYSGALGMTVVLVSSAVLLWAVFPWVSLLLVFANLGGLANPRRILQYVRSFLLPRNRISRVICFAAIKLFETLSILSGYITSLGRPREPHTDYVSDICETK